MIWYDRYEVMLYDMIRYEVMFYDMIRYDKIWGEVCYMIW